MVIRLPHVPPFMWMFQAGHVERLREPASHKIKTRKAATARCGRSRRRRRARAAQPLLDLARARVRVRERRVGIEPERQERDEPFSVRSSRSSRGGPPAASRRSAASISAASTSLAGSASASGSRWVCTESISGPRAHDRALDLLGDLVRLLERQVARQLQVERDSVRPAERDDVEVVDLAHARDAERRSVRALAQRRLVSSGSTWTTTSLPGSARSSAASTRSAAACPWPDGRPRRDADDDVGERPARRLAQPQPRSSTGGSIRAIAARAAASASAGARSMSTSTLRRISRAAATSTSAATKSAAIESPPGKPAARRAARRARRACRRGRCRSGARSRAAPRCRSACAARSETTVRPRSIASTSPTTANAHQVGVDLHARSCPSRRVTASAATRR